MAADSLPQFSPEETCLSAILAKDKMSLKVLATPIAHTPPTLLRSLQSQDPVNVKTGPIGNTMSNENNHDDLQPGSPSSAGGSTLRESKSASPDGGENGKVKLPATLLKLSPGQHPPCSSEPCKISPSSMQSNNRSPTSSPQDKGQDQQETDLPSVLRTEEATPVSATNKPTGSESEQDPKEDDSMAVEYIPFDPQPLWDLVAQCKQKSIQDLQTICRDLDSLNAEIQFVLSDFLTMRFAEIEQMLQSGQINIAQMEREQEEMQSQMVSFLNAIKSSFSLFGHDPRKQL